ncbi:hypothetical protein HYY69_04090 [Candidatus Woesearchaeota archaeon]|nr:hypothetical protein [Candidatus Woesearchaeota archaeon]
MANVLELDDVVIGECEATVLVLPKDFFGNTYFEQGDWSQTKDRPSHIGGTADWAVYPTRHFIPSQDNLRVLLEIAKKHGVTLGRNAEQIASLDRFLDGSLAIADIGDFDASTKPVPISALPYWLFVRSEKDDLGKNITVKTPRLQDYRDVAKLKLVSGAFMEQMLKQDNGIVGVLDRIIIKYQLNIGQGLLGDIYVPADFRVDRIYQMSHTGKGVHFSEPAYITSVECEVNPDGVSPDLLRSAMLQIYNTLYRQGGAKTNIRFGRSSLAEDPLVYVRSVTPTLSDAEFGNLYDQMQVVGKQAWEVYERNPDSINRAVQPANKELMAQLQRVSGRF